MGDRMRKNPGHDRGQAEREQEIQAWIEAGHLDKATAERMRRDPHFYRTMSAALQTMDRMPGVFKALADRDRR